MEKTRSRVWHEPDEIYGMGRMHFGRVSMSVGMMMLLWNVPAGFMFLGGGLVMSSMYQAGQDYLIPSVIASIGAYMLLFTVAVWIVIGLITLVKWIASDIRVDGPR